MYWINERELELRGSQWLVKWGVEAVKGRRRCQYNKYTSDKDEYVTREDNRMKFEHGKEWSEDPDRGGGAARGEKRFG